MEPVQTGVPKDSKNVEPPVEDGISKNEDCNEALSSQSGEEDQSGEQVYGYLVPSSSIEDATIYVNSQGFNLNGQSLIVNQNDYGNEIIIFVSEDPDGQPLDQTFAHASVLHTDEVSFEDGLKEHGTIIVDEPSQSLEFVKTDEVCEEEHEEQQRVNIESGGILNTPNDKQESPGSSVNIESPLWSVSNNGQLKNDSTEMLFIPNPTVVLAPEETEHRNLMQLAYVAQLKSADQSSSPSFVGECSKESETSLNELDSSDKISLRDEEPSSVIAPDVLSPSEEHSSRAPLVLSPVEEHGSSAPLVLSPSEEHCSSAPVVLSPNEEHSSSAPLVLSPNEEHSSSVPLVLSPNEESNDKCSSTDEKEKYLNFNSKAASVVSSFLSHTSVRTIDNAVSVIHSTSSEVQDNSFENPTKLSSPPDFSPDKTPENSESELPSEMLYSNLTGESFHDDSLSQSSSTKEFERSPKDDMDDDSRLSVPDDKSETSHVPSSSLVLDEDDSSLPFVEKFQKLDDNALSIQHNSLEKADPEASVAINDCPSCSVLVVTEELKQHEGSHYTSLIESHVMKDIDAEQKDYSQENNVPMETGSQFDFCDDDDDYERSSNNDFTSTEKNEMAFTSKSDVHGKVEKASSEKTPVLSPLTPDDKASLDSCKDNVGESNMEESKEDNDDDSGENKNVTSRDDFENASPGLVIAENSDDEDVKTNKSNTLDPSSDGDESHDISLIRNTDSKSTSDVDTRNVEESISTNREPETLLMDCASTSVVKQVEPSASESTNKNSTDNRTRMDPDLGKEVERFSCNEETLVKPPKKTYIRKRIQKQEAFENKSNVKERIELFSGEEFNFTECDKEISQIESCLNSDSMKESSSSQNPDEIESDDQSLMSDVRSKVSATYNRKKKTLPPKQRLRPRSLRSSLPLRNGSAEISDGDKRRDSSNGESMAWGDVLLRTSFEPCNVTDDTPSTSFEPPKETSSVPLLTQEQRRRKCDKIKRDFDRLLNNSPVVSKQPKRIKKRHSFGGRKKIIKARRSIYSSPRRSEVYESDREQPPIRSRKKTKVAGQKLKEAKIHYLSPGYPEDGSGKEPSEKKEMFSCSSCNFLTVFVDNLIEHLKYCSSRQPVLDYKVNDMDKRQRIRGEEDLTNTVNSTLKRIRSDLREALMEDDDPPMALQNPYREEETDSDSVRKRRKYGYGEDDVVWVQFKDRFWPALVCDVKGLTAYVKLIMYPKEMKGLKVKHENIRTFDNSKWNLLCLAEAETLPYNEIFVKAVQSCERFMSKKFLGFAITGKEFFSVREEVDFATDSASSASIADEDSDSDDDLEIGARPSRKDRYAKLDIEKILEHIFSGKTDEYVLDIYHRRRHSKKHATFFESDDSSDLKHRPWFGPCEDVNKQEELFKHFQDLFVSKIGKKGYFISYICQVWIPEAIVQAISVVQGIPLEDAELLFESEDSLDLEGSDPSLEDILKEYSASS